MYTADFSLQVNIVLFLISSSNHKKGYSGWLYWKSLLQLAKISLHLALNNANDNMILLKSLQSAVCILRWPILHWLFCILLDRQ